MNGRARRADIDRDAERLRDALRPDGPCVTRLTMKEQEILSMMGLGMKNTEIAEAAGIALSTVRTHTKELHDKTYIEGRARLAIAAFRVMHADGGKRVA